VWPENKTRLKRISAYLTAGKRVKNYKNGPIGKDDNTEIKRQAAMYVRMSTDHQKYSTENQEQAIREYAEKRNIEVITTYADQGKSGLDIGGREALQRLISDVQDGHAAFNTILVLDITRWGRFQDADESAYYEYICRRAGIDVQYVAEQFEVLNAPWPASIAASSQPRYFPDNAV